MEPGVWNALFREIGGSLVIDEPVYRKIAGQRTDE
jgi:hypothetical protein